MDAPRAHDGDDGDDEGSKCVFDWVIESMRDERDRTARLKFDEVEEDDARGLADGRHR